MPGITNTLVHSSDSNNGGSSSKIFAEEFTLATTSTTKAAIEMADNSLPLLLASKTTRENYKFINDWVAQHRVDGEYRDGDDIYQYKFSYSNSASSDDLLPSDTKENEQLPQLQRLRINLNGRLVAEYGWNTIDKLRTTFYFRYDNKNKHGEHRSYYDNGSLESHFQSMNDRLHGTSHNYYLSTSGGASNGSGSNGSGSGSGSNGSGSGSNGSGSGSGKPGELQLMQNYQHGQLHGATLSYYESAECGGKKEQLKAELNYKDGRLHGKAKKWTEAGKLEFKYTYNSDDRRRSSSISSSR